MKSRSFFGTIDKNVGNFDENESAKGSTFSITCGMYSPRLILKSFG